jgi:hypothetical protein
MDKEGRSSGIDKVKLIFLLVIPVLIWNIDYHARGSHFTFCLFKNITGHYCYGCGLLRGSSALLHFDFAEIHRLNKLNPITIPLITWIYLKEFSLAAKNVFILTTRPRASTE